MDKRDKTIIYELEKNARLPDSAIARSIHLSKQVTNYRIKRLEEQGLIKGYYAIINHFALGRQLYRLGLKLRRLTPEIEAELFAYLQKHASWMASTMGLWDVSVAVYAKDNANFLEFWHEFLNKFSNHIEEKWLATVVKLHEYNKAFLADRPETRLSLILSEHQVITDLDELDLRLLRHIATHAREKILDIAQKMDVGERVIRYRLKALEKRQIILGYRPIVDYHALGYSYYKLYVKLENVTPSLFGSLYSFVETIKQVTTATLSVGGFDLEIELYVKSTPELYDIIQHLKVAFANHVKGYSFIEYMKEHKVSYYPWHIGEV